MNALPIQMVNLFITEEDKVWAKQHIFSTQIPTTFFLHTSIDNTELQTNIHYP
jgi:hypothetical protein